MNLYLIGAAIAVVIGLSGGAYIKGRQDGAAAVKAAQLDQYKEAVSNAISEMGLRAAADQSARLDAERFSTRVRKDLAKVREDFHAIPQVIVGSSGCPDLSDAFRMRWDAAEHAASDSGPVASSNPGAMRNDAVSPSF